MSIDNLIDFENLISKNDAFKDVVFNLENYELKIRSFKSQWVSFNNCEFNSKKLSIININNIDLFIEFNDCTFNCDVSFQNCKLDKIIFYNTKKIKSLTFNCDFKKEHKIEINQFKFSNESKKMDNKLECHFRFNGVHFKKYFEFNNIIHKKGTFNFSYNQIGNENDKNFGSCVFNSSDLVNISFVKNSFNNYTSFKFSKFYTQSDGYIGSGSSFREMIFYDNKFNKFNFSEVELFNKLSFDRCDFLSTTWFERCENIKKTHLIFVACEFKGFVLYNGSKLDFLEIDRCTFDKSVSFTDTIFNKIRLFEVKFGGGAYFDEIKINNVKDKTYLKDKNNLVEWKRTLRAIKQELQKTENKIDFNRYRNYELAVHYKELSIKENFKDTTILWATKWSSNFGSWVWAFWFTILSGFFWFVILYRIENSGDFNILKANNFFVGFLRFFLVTDFYNPLVNERAYLTNSLSWLVFIVGKIFIAFGIYEMIQSFRKFKA